MTLDRPLLDNRSAIAAAAVSLLYNERPELTERYGPTGRAKCVHDTEYTVQHLADAMWADDPRLFLDYVEWANATLIAYGVDTADFARSLDLLREALPAHVPQASAEIAAAYLDRALQALPSMPDCPDCELDAPAPVAPNEPAIDASGLTHLPSLARQYLNALLDNDRTGADRLITAEVVRGRQLRDLYVHILAPVQREVGRLWQTGQISVAREHFCTAAVQQLMGRLSMDLLYRERPRHGIILAAAVAGEQHDVGLRTVSDLLETEGWAAPCAGANTPCASLSAEIERLKPHAIALSATMTFNLRRVAEAVAAIRSTPAGRAARILVGGRIFNAGDHLCTRVGGDCRPPDAAAALEAVKDLRKRF